MIGVLTLGVVLPAIKPDGALEHLGQPARARNILAGRVVVNRQTGKEMLVLSNNNEGSGMELIFIDLEKGTAKVFRAPAGAGAEGLTEIPGDRLALGTFYDGTLMIFDLKKMEFIKSVQFPGETYIWGFAMGSDGRAYCGTFPGGKLGALDLSSYTLEDLGAPAAPNYYLRRVVATPDGRILCRFIVEKPTWLVFDPATKKFDPVPEQLQSMPTVPVVWNRYLLSGNRVYDGNLNRVVPPFPIPSENCDPIVEERDSGPEVSPRPCVKDVEWDVHPFLTTQDVLYLRQGRTLWRYEKNDTDLQLVTSMDRRGALLLGGTRDGRVCGVRGQDYFAIKPGDTSLDLRPIPGESAPRSITFLRADSEGRVWGGPPYGQTLFWMDPKTRKVVNTPAISDTRGEVLDVAFLGGATYCASYSGGEVIRYATEKPWDQWNQTNPTTIASISAEGYGRPTGGIIVGPGRQLYSGWTARFGTYGGAVAITDPESGKTELLENPLGEQQIMGLATDGNLLYVATGIDGDGLPTRPGQSSKLGIIDPATKRVIWQQEVSGAQRVRIAGYDASTQIVPTIVDTHIRLFDASTRTFLERGRTAPTVASWSHALPGDGKLYYGSGMQVLALDLRNGTVDTVAEAPGYVNNVAMGPDGTIYFGVGVDLYAQHTQSPSFSNENESCSR